jgi:hypothetical protein
MENGAEKLVENDKGQIAVQVMILVNIFTLVTYDCRIIRNLVMASAAFYRGCVKGATTFSIKTLSIRRLLICDTQHKRQSA